MRIYLARHGETDFNRRGLLQGRRDSALTDLGRDHASALGRWVAASIPTTTGLSVWASPLPRSLATAEIVLAVAGREEPARVDPRLIEIDGGSFEGLTREAASALSPGTTTADVLLLNAPDAEPYESILSRLGAWLADVQAEGGDHLVVGHAGVGRVLRALYREVPRKALAGRDSSHDAIFLLHDGAVTRVENPPNEPRPT